MSPPTLKKLGKRPTRFGVPQKPIDVQSASSAGPNEREVGWIQNGWPQQISAKTTRHSPPTASAALLTPYICHGQSPIEPATPHSPAVAAMPCHGIGWQGTGVLVHASDSDLAMNAQCLLSKHAKGQTPLRPIHPLTQVGFQKTELTVGPPPRTLSDLSPQVEVDKGRGMPCGRPTRLQGHQTLEGPRQVGVGGEVEPGLA